MSERLSTKEKIIGFSFLAVWVSATTWIDIREHQIGFQMADEIISQSQHLTLE